MRSCEQFRNCSLKKTVYPLDQLLDCVLCVFEAGCRSCAVCEGGVSSSLMSGWHCVCESASACVCACVVLVHARSNTGGGETGRVSAHPNSPAVRG